jgi:replicative DNA helicase Mcm
VLEHGIVPVRKAGINRDYFARVPIVASLNPKYGRFDQFEPIPKQVNVPPDTLSRFDLIFMMFDVPKKYEDELTAEHITNLWQKATEVHQKEFEGMNALTKSWGKDKYVPVISLDMIRKWIHEAKKIKVRITPECRKDLNGYFLEIRLAQRGDEDAAIPIAWRTLDGMMRLLICQTRLRHGNVTEMRDVGRVKALVQESFKVMIDPATGKLDSDMISVGMGKSQRDRIKVLREIIRELQKSEGSVPLAEILEKAVESGIKEDVVEDMLAKLKSGGDIIEASNRRFRVV